MAPGKGHDHAKAEERTHRRNFLPRIVARIVAIFSQVSQVPHHADWEAHGGGDEEAEENKHHGGGKGGREKGFLRSEGC